MAPFKRALSCKSHLCSRSSGLQGLIGETVKRGTTGRKTPSKMHSVFEQQPYTMLKHIIKLPNAQSHKSCGIMVHPRFMGFEIQEVHVKVAHTTGSPHIRQLGLHNPDCVPGLSWPIPQSLAHILYVISSYPLCITSVGAVSSQHCRGFLFLVVNRKIQRCDPFLRTL